MGSRGQDCTVGGVIGRFYVGGLLEGKGQVVLSFNGVDIPYLIFLSLPHVSIWSVEIDIAIEP